jgi:hypothetical protein
VLTPKLTLLAKWLATLCAGEATIAFFDSSTALDDSCRTCQMTIDPTQ